MRASLEDFALIVMGVDLDTLPLRVRYRPLTRAIWAALMLDCATLRAFVARATEPGGKRPNDSPADDSSMSANPGTRINWTVPLP